MRKVISSLLIFTTLCFSVLLFLPSLTSKYEANKIGEVINPITSSEELILLQTNPKDTSLVSGGEIALKYSRQGKITIPEYTINKFSSSVVPGVIYTKDTVIDSYVVPYDMVIHEVRDEELVVGKLDETTSQVSFLPYLINEGVLEINLEVRFNRILIQHKSYSVKYNASNNEYDVIIDVQNSGKIPNGSYITVNIDQSYYMYSGLFIEKEFLFQDENGYFVYKFFDRNVFDGYKKIYVDVINYFNQYVEVKGELNEDNIIIIV